MRNRSGVSGGTMRGRRGRRRGMIGILVAVSIMGVLMITSFAMSTLVQTEATIQTSSDFSDRAVDAAFSGTQYVSSFMLDGPNAFATTAASAAQRLYFTLTPNNVAPLWGPIKSSLRPAGGSDNLIQADWMFITQTLNLLTEEAAATADEYYFRAVSFPKKSETDDSIDPRRYMIKSQGRFRQKAGTTTVVQEYRCQIIAEASLTVTMTGPQFKLNRWRRMEFETDAAFNAYTTY